MITSVKDKPVQKILAQLDTLIDSHYKVSWGKKEIPSYWAIDALFSKNLGHFKAIVRLFKGKAFLAESFVLLRSTYESTIILCYILTDPQKHIKHYQDSAANYALKGIEKYKQHNPSSPEFIELYRLLLESQKADKKFKLSMYDYLKHLMGRDPLLFKDSSYSFDLISYFYGTSVSHSEPHALKQLYVDNTPYVGIIGILHCILVCLRLIKFYMTSYGCIFPASIEQLDAKILKKLRTFNEIRENS